MDACKGHVPKPVPDVLQQRFDSKEVHLNPETMAVFAKAWQDEQHFAKTHSAPIKLPYCHTVFAEAYGAVINYGDWQQGPRVTSASPLVGKLPTLAEFRALKKTSVTDRRPVVLKAIQHLAAESIKPTLVLDGPFTLLTQVLGMELVLRSCKKESETVHALLAELASDLVAYALDAEAAGIGSISFADPVAANALLGPRLYEKLVLPHLQVMSNAFCALQERGIPVLVCPVLKSDSDCFDRYRPSCESLDTHAFF